jgi:copper(I)-binding protein
MSVITSCLRGRPRPLRVVLAAAALGSTILLAACNQAPEAPAANEAAASIIAITAPWSRETAEGQNAGGAFMTIANTGTAADRLTGGSTPVAGRVEIHTMTMDGGVMRMRQLADGLEVPAGGEVTLKPGSFHVMLMGLKQPLKAGDTVPLTLTFKGAGTVATELVVKPADTMAPEMTQGEGEQPHG